MSAHERPDLNQEHARIADAVLARKADEAIRLVIAHYMRTWDMIKTTIPLSAEASRKQMAHPLLTREAKNSATQAV